MCSKKRPRDVLVEAAVDAAKNAIRIDRHDPRYRFVIEERGGIALLQRTLPAGCVLRMNDSARADAVMRPLAATEASTDAWLPIQCKDVECAAIGPNGGVLFLFSATFSKDYLDSMIMLFRSAAEPLQWLGTLAQFRAISKSNSRLAIGAGTKARERYSHLEVTEATLQTRLNTLWHEARDATTLVTEQAARADFASPQSRVEWRTIQALVTAFPSLHIELTHGNQLADLLVTCREGDRLDLGRWQLKSIQPPRQRRTSPMFGCTMNLARNGGNKRYMRSDVDAFVVSKSLILTLVYIY